jgi:hypothetical protein
MYRGKNKINHLKTSPIQAARILIREHGFTSANTIAGRRYDESYTMEVKDFYCDVMHSIRKLEVKDKEKKRCNVKKCNWKIYTEKLFLCRVCGSWACIHHCANINTERTEGTCGQCKLGGKVNPRQALLEHAAEEAAKLFEKRTNAIDRGDVIYHIEELIPENRVQWSEVCHYWGLGGKHVVQDNIDFQPLFRAALKKRGMLKILEKG